MKPELRSVVAAFAAVRAEPDDAAAQITHVLAGEPLHVEEWRDAWPRVRTVYDFRGWVREGPSAAETRSNRRGRTLGRVPQGGLTERGIDCSGLVHMAYRRIGRSVPRDADQQEQAGTAVDEPPPGDLVTYGENVAADHSRSGSVATHPPCDGP
jgi:gamma-D-glutamyl-L-lysine dipeptidyl-peptidase